MRILARDTTVANPYFAIFRGTGHGPFRAVELRMPASAQATGGPLLDVQLASTPCVGQDPVMKRFGRDAELQVSPPSPASWPAVYLVYRKPWGKVSFGFTRTPHACLIDVVLDQTPHR